MEDKRLPLMSTTKKGYKTNYKSIIGGLIPNFKEYHIHFGNNKYIVKRYGYFTKTFRFLDRAVDYIINNYNSLINLVNK